MSAPDLSGITDNFFTAAQRGYANSLNGSITAGSTIITVNDITGFANGDAVFLWLEPSSSNAELIYGIVNIATNQLTGCVRGIIGSAAGHSNGATIAQYVSSADHNSMRKGILVEHNEDGTHKGVTTDTLTVTSGTTLPPGDIVAADLASSAVTSAKIATNAVTADKLATSAILLGYGASSTSNQTNASATTMIAITGMSAAVTIPSGGRTVRITAYLPNAYNSTPGTGGSNGVVLGIWDGAVGTGTLLNSCRNEACPPSSAASLTCIAIVTPSAGSKTYRAGFMAYGAGTTANTNTDNTGYLIVELL